MSFNVTCFKWITPETTNNFGVVSVVKRSVNSLAVKNVSGVKSSGDTLMVLRLRGWGCAFLVLKTKRCIGDLISVWA